MKKNTIKTLTCGTFVVMTALYPFKHSLADGIVWHDVKSLNILEGQAWTDTESPYDRLPERVKKKASPATWSQSKASSGLRLRFSTDAQRVNLRWTLTGPVVSQMHMPATSVSGVDFYKRQLSDGSWIFVGNGRPAPDKDVQEVSFSVNRGVLVTPQECMIYFPLYNGVSKMEIGIQEGASIMQPPPYPAGHEKPIVFNGHSIVQGGCASRPGMSAAAIIGRRLNCPIINLGFSAAGHMEPEIAELLGEIDALIYVIDTLTNMNADMINERTIPFVKKIRELQPDTPIVLVGPHHSGNDVIAEKELLYTLYKKLKTEGMENLYYLNGVNMLGRDREGTVDGTHLTDLGFMRQADAYESFLKPLLMIQKFHKADNKPETVTLGFPPRPATKGIDYVSNLLEQAETKLTLNSEILKKVSKLENIKKHITETRQAMDNDDYAEAVKLLCLDIDSDYHRALHEDVSTEFVYTGWKISRLIPKTGDYASLCNAPLPETEDPGMEFKALDPDIVMTPGLVNLYSIFGKDDGLVYLALEFSVPAAGEYMFGLGHDGGARLWVNGESILCVQERQNPCFADRSTALLNLKEGRHELMIAFDTDTGMGWGVRVRFLSPDGQPKIMAAFPKVLKKN